ncbi:MAG: archaeosortase/exosortase family protein, partial [Exilibacterium sp.]
FRLVFQQLPFVKVIFIYPTGFLTNAFYGTGFYLNSEWVYFLDNTKFVLGESCSGTTFFSILVAYLIYAKIAYNISLLWLLFAYPITLISNSMRVLSSIYAHNVLASLKAQSYGDYIHVMTGTVTFLSCLLLIAVLIEKTRKVHNNEEQNITT